MTTIARRRFILVATSSYILLGLGWIFFSDQLLAAFADVQSMVWLSTAKGVFFVLATAAGLFFALSAVPSASVVGSEQLLNMLVDGVSHKTRPAWFTYSAAVVLTLVTLVVRQWLQVHFGPRPLLNLFMFPIILSAFLGGAGPGLLATALAAAGANFLALTPVYSLRVGAAYDLLQWSFLIINGVAISTLCAVMRRSQANSEVNRKLLEAVVAGSSDAIFVKDTQGRYLFVNAAAAEVIGRAASEIIGRDNHALMQEAAAHQAQSLEREILQEKVRRTYEQQFTGADGASHTYLVTKGPVLDQAGGVAGVFGVSRDITAQKQAETALRNSERRFHDIASASADWVWEMDADYRYTFASDSVRNMLGYGAEEIIGKTPFDFMPDDEADAMRNALVNFVTQREPFRDLAAVSRHRDGSLRHVQMNGVPVLDADGVLQGYRGLDRDVTASIRSAEELDRHREHLEEMVAERTRQLEAANLSALQQQQFIRTVADAIPSLVAYWDTELRCRFSNAQYVEWFNRTPAEMVGMHIRDVLGEELFAVKSPHLETALRGERQQFHWTQHKPDGSCRYAFSTYIPDIADGGVRGIYVLTSDITEIKLAEIKLVSLNEELALRAREAEAASRAKSAFLANMSHEIRTPMNAIVGLTHLLRRAEVTPDQAVRLDKIDSSGRHLLSIINDILDVSKIEAGRLQLETVDFHLSAILDNVHSIIADEARAKGLKIEIDPDSVPAWLRGDPTRLRQALLNYAGNAVKFTERGKIALRAILLEERGEHLLVRFEVEDSGIGIPQEKLPGLFDAFEQADVSTTRRFGGSGLGLTITRRLAGMMGGEANASSMPGQGSIFWFTAWLSRGRGMAESEPVAERADAEVALRQFHGARLLLVEDNIINREVALQLIHAVGLSADTAENGNEAVAKARAGAYDLVLMDMQMPELDGLDATRAIRRLPGWEHVPIVAMTANAFDDDRAACKGAGMNDFISKPVDPALFFATLHRWLIPAAGTGTAMDAAQIRPVDTKIPIPAEIIPALPGIDTASGLSYANGKTEAYLSLLKKFRDNHVVSFSRYFHAARMVDDWDAATRLAHTLRGLALTVGATDLSEIAGQLEQASKTRRRERAAELAAGVEDELQHLAAGLSRLGNIGRVARPTAASGASPTLPLLLIDQLIRLFASRDTAAGARLLELEAVLAGTEWADRLQPIVEAAGRYDYATAQRRIEELQEQLKKDRGNRQ